MFYKRRHQNGPLHIKSQQHKNMSLKPCPSIHIPVSNLIYFCFHKIGKGEERNVSKFWKARIGFGNSRVTHSLLSQLIEEATHFDNEGEGGGLRDSDGLKEDGREECNLRAKQSHKRGKVRSTDDDRSTSLSSLLTSISRKAAANAPRAPPTDGLHVLCSTNCTAALKFARFVGANTRNLTQIIPPPSELASLLPPSLQSKETS